MSRLGQQQQQRASGVRNIVSNIRHAIFKLVISIFFLSSLNAPAATTVKNMLLVYEAIFFCPLPFIATKWTNDV